MTWYYDPDEDEYWSDEELPVGDTEILEEENETIAGLIGAAVLLLLLLRPDEGSPAITPATFEELVWQQIVRGYSWGMLLGIGGLGQMRNENWRALGLMLDEQRIFFNRFMGEIRRGELTTEKIAARLQMYFNSSREGYEYGRWEAAMRRGATEELWVLGAAEHCDDCLGFAADGWQPIGTFPLPGEGATQCLTNCQCHKEYK